MNKTVYLTAYALSKGTISKETVERESINSKEIFLRCRGHWRYYKLGRYVFENFDDAVADANARRDKRIKSLEKQIAKLRALKFEEQQP